ncbi:MAG: hypothetical protein ACOC1F_05390, partial [Myxococcota bacterium]
DLACVSDGENAYCTPFCDEAGGCPLWYECDVNQNVCLKSGNEGCGPYNDCGPDRVCVDDGGKYCTQYCGADGACPDGFGCDRNQNICFRSQPTNAYDDGGTTTTASCSVSGAREDGSSAWWLLPGLLGLGLLRRRR